MPSLGWCSHSSSHSALSCYTSSTQARLYLVLRGSLGYLCSAAVCTQLNAGATFWVPCHTTGGGSKLRDLRHLRRTASVSARQGYKEAAAWRHGPHCALCSRPPGGSTIQGRMNHMQCQLMGERKHPSQPSSTSISPDTPPQLVKYRFAATQTDPQRQKQMLKPHPHAPERVAHHACGPHTRVARLVSVTKRPRVHVPTSQ